MKKTLKRGAEEHEQGAEKSTRKQIKLERSAGPSHAPKARWELTEDPSRVHQDQMVAAPTLGPTPQLEELQAMINKIISRRTSSLGRPSGQAFLSPVTPVRTWSTQKLSERFNVEASSQSILTWGADKFIVGAGGDSVLLLNSERQPLGPATRGSHGVLLDTPEHKSLYRSLVKGRPFAVFLATTIEQCIYLGHYRAILPTDLTYDEWRCLPQQTKYCWYHIANGRDTWKQSIRGFLRLGDSAPVNFSELESSMKTDDGFQLSCWTLEYLECRNDFMDDLNSKDIITISDDDTTTRNLTPDPKSTVEDPVKERISPDVINIHPIVQARSNVSPSTPILNASLQGFVRNHISSIFGGSPQEMISEPGGERVVLDNVLNLCFLPFWNPCAPSQPGEHGVLFRSPEGMVQDIPSPESNGITLFRRRGAKDWVYMGQYRAWRIIPLTPEEWETLDEKTKTQWFKKANSVDLWRDEINSHMEGKNAGEEVTKAEFLTAMQQGFTKIDCWFLEFIRYRREYVDVLTGDLTLAEAQEKAESSLGFEENSSVKPTLVPIQLCFLRGSTSHGARWKCNEPHRKEGLIHSSPAQEARSGQFQWYE
ncbi:hypothetical protein DL93DRAFT_2099323 [Clavulina sp. PMI_390]|nr:hypothetical protein DL93DRAFT_2099323 [Clavulina sp. PMI_390]